MEPQPNPLQELQIKEKEKSRETDKKEIKITGQTYAKTTNQPVKQEIKSKQNDNQVKPSKTKYRNSNAKKLESKRE